MKYVEKINNPIPRAIMLSFHLFSYSNSKLSKNTRKTPGTFEIEAIPARSIETYKQKDLEVSEYFRKHNKIANVRNTMKFSLTANLERKTKAGFVANIIDDKMATWVLNNLLLKTYRRRIEAVLKTNDGILITDRVTSEKESAPPKIATEPTIKPKKGG